MNCYKKYIISFLGVLMVAASWSEDSWGQSDFQELEVDTLAITLDEAKTINDYSMIGIQYGAGYSRPSWSPAMQQRSLFVPYNFGVLYTRYGKMFGYMPYFGFQLGLFYGREGYAFEEDENGRTPNVQGATMATMEVVELPFMAHFHFDFWKMKIMANIGFYGGYRLSIRRYGDYVPSNLEYAFNDSDRRFDYGIHASGGLGLMLDPVEFHITVSYKYAFSSLYDPDYASQYYYRYAYPTNLIVSFGVHFQLTRRTGKTRRELKRLARENVGLIQSIQETVSPAGDGSTYEMR